MTQLINSILSCPDRIRKWARGPTLFPGDTKGGPVRTILVTLAYPLLSARALHLLIPGLVKLRRQRPISDRCITLGETLQFPTPWVRWAWLLGRRRLLGQCTGSLSVRLVVLFLASALPLPAILAEPRPRTRPQVETRKFVAL